MLMMGCGATPGVAATIYAYFVYGIKSTTVEVKIPFTDEKSNIEFIINMILQFTIFIHGFFIYLGIETIMDIFQNVAQFSPILIKSRLKQLEEMNEKGELSEAQVYHMFKDIVKQALDCDK